MKRLIEVDQWKIIEKELHPDDNRLAESVMSLGNGHMGMRGNFEETYTGDTHLGIYVGGVYYPDKTRVGWWKNGYPEYFAKVLNATNFIGIRVFVGNEELDLHTWKVDEFERTLNMQHGYLVRTFRATSESGKQILAKATRFFSIVDHQIVAVNYEVTPLNFDGEITFIPFLNGEVRNEDANYDEDFWEPIHHQVFSNGGSLTMRTRKTEFDVTTTMSYAATGGLHHEVSESHDEEEYVDHVYKVQVKKNEKVSFNKYIAVTTSRDYGREDLVSEGEKLIATAEQKGFEQLFTEQKSAWEKRWNQADVEVVGDAEAQQGIRFNIFQLYNTYTGEDPRLNIGPKGFTGEKYGGSTYWDTEAYCLPFYLSTADSSISKNLLLYRYQQLEKAKENAAKLGLEGALYPMVTMNGEESHNEWEITFEEIHRNGAIAHAIWNYVNYTGDQEYLHEYGLEVLVEISRFWASRVHWNPRKEVYMMLGVTGPNEYENNVNNNYYTNRIAAWTLEYTLETAAWVKENHAKVYAQLSSRLGFSDEELAKWKDIHNRMYYPIDEKTGLYMQQDGFMDKELLPVAELDPKHLPINQNWSWDRILRSCYIKQADVLQGMYFLNDRYTVEEKRSHFAFYEPLTVHESSLSPCVHSILAAEIGEEEKAYEMYLRTARLDLDNYNNDTEDGLHITSMAGSWLSIVHGFAGLRVREGELYLSPFVPKAWKEYSFKINFRGHLLKVKVNHEGTTIAQENGDNLVLNLHGKKVTV
ncbi:glycoside hydrolase family 65 protein [Bacillaceae bacterium S4-13-58]